MYFQLFCLSSSLFFFILSLSGKVEEILGPINEVYFTVKLDPGVNASSFKEDAKFFIDPMKLLPQSRFLPQPPAPKGSKPRGGAGGGARGGFSRGGFGGRGGFQRGGAGGRGGFSSRGGGGFRGRGAPAGGRGGFGRGRGH
jgi:H/ACA ribonucleoprotein complex subunit 1